MDLWVRILLFYTVLLVSLVVHEAAHALLGLLGGDRTAYVGGQVTLNPIPHIRREPLGTVILPLGALIMSQGTMCMGFAHAPYDPIWAYHHPRRAALMSAAGPLSNVLLALLAFGVLKGLIAFDLGEAITTRSGAGQHFARHLEMIRPLSDDGSLRAVIKIASVFLLLNVLLAFINVFPIPPFDGASVVEGLFPRTRAFFSLVRGQLVLMIVGLLIVWRAIDFWFWPVLGWVYRLL